MPATVLSRWATTRAVRPSISRHRASWTRSSLSESSALVASSSSRIGASRRIARARATRWRWPPESLTPRSPTNVWKPSRSCSANSVTCAAAAAAYTSSSVAPGRAKAMLSRRLRWNMAGSWGT
ncbi:hypothetical protein SFUMM280S_11484 [Streptomyces fumanus]